MPLHGLGIAARQDEGGTDAALRTDGAEDVDGLRALILRGYGSASPCSPSPRELGFLADPGFILPPDFYVGIGRETGANVFQRDGEVFLKSSTANSFCP